jgi:methionine-gamma-lyase
MGFDVLADTPARLFQSDLKRRIVIADALATQGPQLTTQEFPSPAELASAFSGELVALNEAFVADVVLKIRRKCHMQLEKHGITDDELKRIVGMPWIYSRLTTPIHWLLEQSLAQLEGAESALTFASGMAAISAVLQQFTLNGRPDRNGMYVPGEKIVVVGSIYGGTYACIKDLEDEGRQYEHLSIRDFLDNGLPSDASIVYFETCNNPTLKVVPIREIVAAANEIDALTVCDNTFAPMLVQPHRLGVHVVVHSMTKYMNGSSEDLGGCVTGNRAGLVWLLDLHRGKRMLHGGVMAPRVAREFMNNMVDLPERLVVCSANARGVSDVADEFGFQSLTFDKDPRAAGIRNPDFPEGVSNSMVALYLDTKADAHFFVEELGKLGIGKCAVSLGATTTYVSGPAETTHSELSPGEQKRVGITPGLVRISCGVEHDLVEKVRMVLQKLKR